MLAPPKELLKGSNQTTLMQHLPSPITSEDEIKKPISSQRDIGIFRIIAGCATFLSFCSQFLQTKPQIPHAETSTASQKPDNIHELFLNEKASRQELLQQEIVFGNSQWLLFNEETARLKLLQEETSSREKKEMVFQLLLDETASRQELLQEEMIFGNSQWLLFNEETARLKLLQEETSSREKKEMVFQLLLDETTSRQNLLRIQAVRREEQKTVFNILLRALQHKDYIKAMVTPKPTPQSGLGPCNSEENKKAAAELRNMMREVTEKPAKFTQKIEDRTEQELQKLKKTENDCNVQSIIWQQIKELLKNSKQTILERPELLEEMRQVADKLPYANIKILQALRRSAYHKSQEVDLTILALKKWQQAQIKDEETAIRERFEGVFENFSTSLLELKAIEFSERAMHLTRISKTPASNKLESTISKSMLETMTIRLFKTLASIFKQVEFFIKKRCSNSDYKHSMLKIKEILNEIRNINKSGLQGNVDFGTREYYDPRCGITWLKKANDYLNENKKELEKVFEALEQVPELQQQAANLHTQIKNGKISMLQQACILRLLQQAEKFEQKETTLSHSSDSLNLSTPTFDTSEAEQKKLLQLKEIIITPKENLLHLSPPQIFINKNLECFLVHLLLFTYKITKTMLNKTTVSDCRTTSQQLRWVFQTAASSFVYLSAASLWQQERSIAPLINKQKANKILSKNYNKYEFPHAKAHQLKKENKKRRKIIHFEIEQYRQVHFLIILFIFINAICCYRRSKDEEYITI
jgi:hypothetical protein